MEDSERLSATRAASSRTFQACQRCRSLKTRCLPSAQANVCQKCSGAGKDCIWAEVPRRRKKLRAPSRISQVEQKIDGLVAKLVNSAESNNDMDLTAAEVEAEHQTAPTEQARQQSWFRNKKVAPGSWMPVPSFELGEVRREEVENGVNNTEVDGQYLEQLRSIHSFGDNADPAQAPASLFSPSKRPEAAIEDSLVQQILTTGEADTLIDDYRQMSASFPFIIIPRSVTGMELHKSRPMLLLAIITVASWKDHQRQMSLDHIFRTELADRTIIRPRRTLGLVQSVLVYLSWYHFVFSHKTQQIFFLQHLVIGLALDIGLHQDHQPPSFPQRPVPPPPPLPAEVRRERHRAFLGCYYLASMIAAGLQKPNLLKHTPQMTEWAQNLKRDREYDSDDAISHLISLRKIDDQIHDSLFAGEFQHMPFCDARTSIHVHFREAQLDAWKRESVGTTSQRLLDLSSSFTDMWLHSVALRKQPIHQASDTDSTQLNALVLALEAGKRFMDALLTFPAEEYHMITFSEWMRLPTVIITIARLCMPSEAHNAAGWNVKSAQDRVRLDLCLESLCYRMQSLSTYDKTKQQHPDFWCAMRLINDLTKSWYVRKIRLAAPTITQAPSSELSSGRQTVGGVTEPDSAVPTMDFMNAAGHNCTTVAGASYTNGVNMELELGNNHDVGPFAFMKDIGFDMEQFLDIGIWGDESYTSMGFGGGMPFS